MPIIENRNKFCRKCRTLLKNSLKGPVCRNPRCKFFVSFEEVPLPQEIMIPHEIKDSRCCPCASIDVKKVFESMQYLGSVQSRTNQYFCYSYQNVYINFTGLKEKTNTNAFTLDDLNIIEMIMKNHMGNGPFSCNELRLKCLNFHSTPERIKKLANIKIHNDDEFDQLYYFILNCCYTLTALGFLTLRKQGHAILFSQNPQRIIHAHEPSVYSKLRYLINVNKNTAVFDMNSFYLEVRFNEYRGTIIPYTKEEIGYLSELVDALPSRKKLDIADLMNSMDYSHRFHRLYDLLEFRNLRNDREDKEFFQSRIKSGLELVAKLDQNIRVDKEGHTKVFYKR